MMRKPLVLILLLVGISTNLLAQESGLVHLFWGGASLMRGGWNNWLGISSRQPMPVKSGDKIRTELKTYAQVKLSDGSSINVKPETVLLLGDHSLQLQSGEIWVHATKQRESFQIMTPNAVCTILGTVVNVSVDLYGKTRVRTLEGIVSVRAVHDPRKRQLVLQRGMMTTIGNDARTDERPQNFSPEPVEKDLGATVMPLPKPSGPKLFSR